MVSDTQLVKRLQATATRLRINSIKSTEASASGHPTSCASMADILAVLFFKEMRYKTSIPRCPTNDRFVLSKRLNFIDLATGSLGQGLSNAVGMAYVGKYIDKANYRVYCLIGDGESAEGSIWEAIAFASYYKLDNLVIIFDINRLGQSQVTPLQHDMETYYHRTKSFGCHSVIVDGHNIEALVTAFSQAHIVKDKPVALLCKTFKGHGFPKIADLDNWHGKPLGNYASDVISHLEAQLVDAPIVKFTPPEPTPDCSELNLMGTIKLPSPPSYKIGDLVATRVAYGNGLVRLGQTCDRIIALDGDTKNSTYSIKLLESKPNQFIECFIAEQNLVGVGIGCGVRGRTIPFVSTFGAFFTRAFDQIRMGAVSQTNCNFVGSHVGVSIGEDGPSQMALEDISMFRSVIGTTVFYPSDAVSTERAVELAANTKGICYIRTGRPNQPVIYTPEEPFFVGNGKVIRTAGPTKDHLTVVAAGITLTEALKAADLLLGEGINIRVIDPFTIKPMDTELLVKAVKETCSKVITVEDHVPEGGIGDSVSAALSSAGVQHYVHRMAIREIPHSGKCDELLNRYNINGTAIVSAVKLVLKK